MCGGEASRVDGERDVRERRGGQGGAGPDFPDVVPGADVEGRGDGLPCGTAVCGGEFDGDVADAGGPLCDAQLAGTRGHVTAILAAHMLDAGADLRLTRHAPTLPRRHHRICFPLYHCRLTSTRLHHRCRVHAFFLSFIRFRVAEQNTAWRAGSARVHARFYGRWMNSAPASYRRGRGRVMRSRFP